MIRKIITINEEKCNGCGLCADACHEGAIGMVDGKARLLREDYCERFLLKSGRRLPMMRTLLPRRNLRKNSLYHVDAREPMPSSSRESRRLLPVRKLCQWTASLLSGRYRSNSCQ